MDNIVLLEPKATLSVLKIPGCAHCHIPPKPSFFGFAGECPRCGSATPPFSDVQIVDAEVLNG